MDNPETSTTLGTQDAALVNSSYFLYNIRHVTHIVKLVKRRVGDRGQKENIRRREENHCHLRSESFVMVNKFLMTTVQ
jgi:hypothetical protein